jgi:hypothetical protein
MTPETDTPEVESCCDGLNYLHRYCHTREGVGHDLQAGESATGSFIQGASDMVV